MNQKIQRLEALLTALKLLTVIPDDVLVMQTLGYWAETKRIVDELKTLFDGSGSPVSDPMHVPPHPGAVLKEMYLKEMKIPDCARRLGMSPKNLSRLIRGKAAVSPKVAAILAQAFPASSPRLWLDLQLQYDLWQLGQTPLPVVEPLMVVT
jgi:antitoxin HigA-1